MESGETALLTNITLPAARKVLVLAADLTRKVLFGPLVVLALGLLLVQNLVELQTAPFTDLRDEPLFYQFQKLLLLFFVFLEQLRNGFLGLLKSVGYLYQFYRLKKAIYSLFKLEIFLLYSISFISSSSKTVLVTTDWVSDFTGS